VLKDDTRLATLADVRAFILNEPEHVQSATPGSAWPRCSWNAAENGGSIEAATALLELALFLEARRLRR
jgi:hypothetical protein